MINVKDLRHIVLQHRGASARSEAHRHTHIDIQVTTMTDPITTIIERLNQCEKSIKTHEARGDHTDGDRLQQLELLLSHVKAEIAHQSAMADSHAPHSSHNTPVDNAVSENDTEYVYDVTPDAGPVKRRAPPQISPSDLREKVPTPPLPSPPC